MRRAIITGLLAAALLVGRGAQAGEIRVLTTGAFKQALLAALATFHPQDGDRITVDNDTAGALVRRITAGEAFDLVVLTPAAIADFTRQGRIIPGTGTDLARVGVGVVVRAGAPQPDIGSVDAFRQAVLDASSVAYIDPASGGSSGIYVAQLLQQLGIADQVRPKAVLVPGGLVAERVASGEAQLGIHQISEILPVPGVVLVGPLPPAIQNYTTYSAGIGTGTTQAEAARALLTHLVGAADHGYAARQGHGAHGPYPVGWS